MALLQYVRPGQAAEMLGLGYHEAEALFKKYGAEQQPSWEEQQQDAQAVRELLGR